MRHTETEKETNLEQLLDQIRDQAQSGERLSLGAVVDAVGRRSFGPAILLAGLVTLAPLIGDIPGMPTLMGLLVLLTAVQLLIGRECFWLPRWLLRRSVSTDKLCKALGWFRPVARVLDRLSRPRLTVLTQNTGAYAIAVACIIIAAAMPPMELIPFSANAAGIALTAFGLALTAHDGLLALLALVFTLGTLGFIGYEFL